MPRIVPPDGTGRERIVIIGEMPAQNEEQLGRPLVGWSGQLMMKFMREVGIERRDCYIDNVVPYRHNPKNLVSLVPQREVENHIEELHHRLAKLYDPWLIVPLGATAMYALTGLGKPPWRKSAKQKDKPKDPGITKFRGSIYEYSDHNGRRIKTIPTIHTAALARQPAWERRCRLDWKRIAGDAKFRELHLPERTHFIEPTYTDVCDYVEDARQHAECVVIDIETPFKRIVEQRTLKSGKPGKPRVTKGPRRMTVFGASYDPSFGFVIPTTEDYWERRGVPLEKVMEKIRELCALPCPKGGQSAAGFDRFWLHWYGIDLVNYVYDTRWMSHALDPLDEHSLAYQQSIWTREPFHKDDGKEDDTDIEGMYDIKTYWTYNSKDCTVERELVEINDVRLANAKRTSYYLRRYVSLYDSMLHISLGGMLASPSRRARLHAQYTAEQFEAQDKITAIVKRVASVDGKKAELYGKKGSLSYKKLAWFLYDQLRLPKQTDRKTKGITTKEIVVRKLMLKYPAKLGTDKQPDAIGSLILRHRRLEAVKRFTKIEILDEDGYRRSQYGFTYTMRFTAGKNPRRTGNNSQNDDREILALGMFVPDPGHIFVEVDLSQAERRIVLALAASLRSTLPRRSEELLWRARAMPWENDEHRRAAYVIFPGYKSWQDVPSGNGSTPETGLHRYLGKRSNHAAAYGMRGKTLAESLIKEGLTYTDDECEGFIDTTLDKDTPEVRDWQRWVRQTVVRDKKMTEGWGGIVDVRYERLDETLYRKMYAYQPQKECTGIIKYWGLVPLYEHLNTEVMYHDCAPETPPRVANEKHDSLLISTPPIMAWPIVSFLRGQLERPRLYNGIELMVPCEFKLGLDASMPVEFKRFPERDEFETAVAKLTGR